VGFDVQLRVQEVISETNLSDSQERIVTEMHALVAKVQRNILLTDNFPGSRQVQQTGFASDRDPYTVLSDGYLGLVHRNMMEWSSDLWDHSQGQALTSLSGGGIEI